jgi:hypothetical protein
MRGGCRAEVAFSGATPLRRESERAQHHDRERRLRGVDLAVRVERVPAPRAAFLDRRAPARSPGARLAAISVAVLERSNARRHER